MVKKFNYLQIIELLAEEGPKTMQEINESLPDINNRASFYLNVTAEKDKHGRNYGSYFTKNEDDNTWSLSDAGWDYYHNKSREQLQSRTNRENINIVDMSNKIIVESYKTLLEKNHNIILHGAPGTGKTYLAHQIAEAMGATFEMVQFHPSYDYTDFVEGLRPKNNDKRDIVFERMDGIFKAFCKKAIISHVIDTTAQYTSEQLKSAWDKLIESKIESLALKEGGQTKIHKKTDNSIKFTDKSGEQQGNDVTFRRIQSLSLKFPTLDSLEKRKVSDIADKKIGIGGCDSSKYWAVLHYLYTKLGELPIPKFVFLIDEINRGDLSKIFGELFFSIDPGYRVKIGEEDKAKRVPTQYQNLVAKTYTIKNEDGTEEVLDDPFYKGFYIPENVYIIGTMNDIDRSVESMDFAMRRRFQFVEVKAEDRADQMFTDEETDTKYQNADRAKDKLEKLNKCISEKVENKGIGLTSAYHIGPSYFMKYAKSEESIQELWDYRLEGLLREYLRGEDDANGKLDLLKEIVLGENKTAASNYEDNTTEQKE